MSHYLSNVRDLEFNLFEVFGIQDRVDEATMRDLMGELDRLATGPLAESFADADRVPPVFDPVAGTVTVPESLKKAYRLLREGGWHRLMLPTELGGAGLPSAVRWAATELLVGANPALYLYFSAGPRCATMLHQLGTPHQRRWARLMIDRDWGATMAMTEPDAGSDVGAARTTATRQPDGSWHLQGVKRFITAGDQDLTENIMHVVLARPVAPGLSPPPGAKGLSVFLVPKYLFDPHTGEPRARNGVYATNLEHKMGLRGSATCELTFGASTPAQGWLLGERHDGIAQMFHAIEWARMTVGAKAIATLSTGHRNALAYARTRVQGPDLRRLLDKTAPRVAIIDHPDVRRMLMMQKAYAEGLRALLLHTANAREEFEAGSENSGEDGGESRRAAFDAVRDVLVPIVKGVSADRAYEQLGSALQVYGGSGYLQDYPIEQYLRDAKIDSLYEGTTAIQSLDFFFRQIVRDNGRVWTAILNGLRPPVHEPRLATEHRLLDHAVTDMRGMVAAMNRFLAAIDVHPDSIYRVGQNTVRLLHAAGDLFVAGFLLRQAILALAALDRRPPPKDRAFYEGKVAVASYFARTVLPSLAATREIVETTDNTLMKITPEAF